MTENTTILMNVPLVDKLKLEITMVEDANQNPVGAMAKFTDHSFEIHPSKVKELRSKLGEIFATLKDEKEEIDLDIPEPVQEIEDIEVTDEMLEPISRKVIAHLPRHMYTTYVLSKSLDKQNSIECTIKQINELIGPYGHQLRSNNEPYKSSCVSGSFMYAMRHLCSINKEFREFCLRNNLLVYVKKTGKYTVTTRKAVNILLQHREYMSKVLDTYVTRSTELSEWKEHNRVKNANLLKPHRSKDE